jgi:hypothetical protein
VIDFQKIKKEALDDRVEMAVIAFLNSLGLKPRSEIELKFVALCLDRAILACQNNVEKADWVKKEEILRERGY